MVVITHERWNYSGSNYATVSAYDGTDNTTPTLLWRYDLGLADATNSTKWQPGHPRIDADGNVYVPSWGIIGYNAGGAGNHDYAGQLTKLDSTGALVWNYQTETYRNNNSTMASVVGDGLTRGPGCTLMDGGNILFGHPREPTSTNIMSIVDPTGSYVSGIPYPGGSIPTITTDTGPIDCLDVDSSGNIYFTPLTSTGIFEIKVYKVSSSGSYIGTCTALDAQCSVVRVDRTNSKFYIGTYQPASWSASKVVVAQIDCSTLSADWQMSLTDMAGTASTAQSRSLQNSLSLSADGSKLYGGMRAANSGGTTLVQTFAVNANTGTKGVIYGTFISATAGTTFAGAACDPTSGNTFGVQMTAQLADRIWKTDGTGTALWHTLSITGIGNAARFIDARTF